MNNTRPGNMPIPPQQGYGPPQPQPGYAPQPGYGPPPGQAQPPQQAYGHAPPQAGSALTGLVAFGSYEIHTAQEEETEAEKAGGGAGWYNLKDGANILRVMPPKPGGTTPFIVRYRHWLDLPNGESVKFNCPLRMGGQHCPICETANKLKASNDKGEREAGFAMSPQRQAICVVIDRNNPEAGPLACQLPGKTVYDPLIHLRTDARGGGDYTHPIDGFDVVIRRSGSGKKIKYEVLADRNNSQLAETVEQMNEWIMAQPDIAAYSAIPTVDEIQTMIAEASGQQPQRAAQAAPAPAPQLGAPPNQSWTQPQQPTGYGQPGHGQRGYANAPQGGRAESQIYQNPGDYTPTGQGNDDIPF